MGVSESRLGCQPGLSGWSGGGKVIGSFQETRCRGERGGEETDEREERGERRRMRDSLGNSINRIWSPIGRSWRQRWLPQ